MKQYSLISILFLLIFLNSHGQKRQITYRAEMGGGIGADRLPFWLHSNTFGKIAEDTYLWGTAGAFIPYGKTGTRAFDYSFRFESTAAWGKDDNRIFINQLYGSIRWQNLVIEAGMGNCPVLYDGLSASNGNMLYSGNTRNMPGISFSSWDYIKFPWVGKWLAFQFKYAEYVMPDKRYIDNAHVHNKLLAGRLTVIPQLSIEAGIEDYVQWGGKNPVYGKLKYSFKDYIKIVGVRPGGGNASRSDQINKLGNHIGRHFARISYENARFKTSLYYNHMFEDGSGMRFKNWPDGLYGMYFSRKEGGKWFKSLVYEFYYTKNQSGPLHDRPATPEEREQQDPSDPFYGRIVLGGNDSYLNHGEYQSGWTLYGRSIGVPFFTPETPVAGITYGIRNNRFYAHHLGICGHFPLLDIRYKLLCSYSRNYGTYGIPFQNAKGENTSQPQLSLGLELVLPEHQLPFHTALHIGYDEGKLLKHHFGIMLSIFKTGMF